MKKIFIKFFLVIWFFIGFFCYGYYQDYRFFLTKNIELSYKIKNQNIVFSWNIDWGKFDIKNLNYYSITHSNDAKQWKDYVFYGNNIEKNEISDELFFNYDKKSSSPNYYRICLFFENKMSFCNKNILVVNEKFEDEKNYFLIALYIFIGLYGCFWAYRIIKKFFYKKIYKSKTLQIFKNEENYTIEYDGIYNKGIKVFKKNISEINKFLDIIVKYNTNFRGNILNQLDEIPQKNISVNEIGKLIFRLFLPENIRNELKNIEQDLIIKTDEQEVPWEILHDGENFLSLKIPLARNIMTRENIRKNNYKKNKKLRILFITNPTNDLKETITETHEIIKEIGNKAHIFLLKHQEASSLRILYFLSKNDIDIIHYSGHTYFDKKNPENSGLILGENDVLTSNQIKRVLNGNPLIFFNSCYSGKTINDDKNFLISGEDNLGIASSFIIGGAKGVISSLWNIDDEMAKYFAINFYRNFLKGKNIGESILQAKKDMYFKNPLDITWASFIYYGDPSLKSL